MYVRARRPFSPLICVFVFVFVFVNFSPYRGEMPKAERVCLLPLAVFQSNG